MRLNPRRIVYVGLAQFSQRNLARYKKRISRRPWLNISIGRAGERDWQVGTSVFPFSSRKWILYELCSDLRSAHRLSLPSLSETSLAASPTGLRQISPTINPEVLGVTSQRQAHWDCRSVQGELPASGSDGTF